MGATNTDQLTNYEHVSYFQIFRYATWLELMATVVGVLFGIMSAGGICYNMVHFGEMSTAFVERVTYPQRMTSYMPLMQAFGGGRILVNATRAESTAALLEDAHALAIALFTVIIISIFFCIISVSLISWSALKQITRIRMHFLKAVLSQDMSWFDTDSEFNLASSMSENLMKIKDGLGEKLSIVANLVGTTILCFCTAFPLGWELSLACITVVPFSLAASVALSKYQTNSSIREMKSFSKAGKQAEEVLKSVRTVVAFSGESKEIERYKSLLEPAENFARRSGIFSGLGNAFNWVLTYLLNTIGIAYGTKLVLDDFHKEPEERRYAVGVIFSILFAMYMATQSITLCVPHSEAFSAARGAAAAIFSIIDRKPQINSMATVGVSPRRVVGDITIKDVHFSYPARPESKILQGFSLHIKAGEYVALVGSSGCGKSTILQLLQRMYDPQSGTVMLDGKDLKNLNIGWLRSSLGVVGQEPVLFRGTIRDNISMARPEATDEEVQRVAEMAYAHDFIKKLPDGYETVIGERGGSLSGGQKQRIAIARALLLEPAVLLLDEATSALDPPSERRVQAALDRARLARSTVSVSHRLSTIVNADRIVCMDRGVIVEQGTHDELMKSMGFYYNLVKTGSRNQEAEEIETVIEENKSGEINNDILASNRSDRDRRSTKIIRNHSSKRASQDWVVPRCSVTSAMSTGLQSFSEHMTYDSDVEETDEVDEQGNIKSISDLTLLKLNGPEWPLLVSGSIAATIQGACFPVFSIIFGYTIAIFALPDQSEIQKMANIFASLFVVVAFVAGASMCVQGIVFTSAGLKMTTRLRLQYFSALLKQEMGYFDQQRNTVGALCARLSGDAAEVQGATGLRIGLILQGVSSLSIGIIMSLAYNWKMTLVASSFLPLMIGSIWFDGIMSRKSQRNEQKAMEAATSIATEAVVSIKTVQSLGVEERFIKKFEEALREANVAVAKKNRWRGLVLGLGIYVPFMSFCCAAVYGALLVSRGEVTYKVVLLIDEAIMYGAYMLGQSLVFAPSMSSAKACAARILSVIHRQPRVATEPGIKDKKDWVATGNFKLKDVEFSYPTRPHHQILRGINLKVEAGKTVALVGSSGCGKSTVLQLLQRFYDPVSGNIELDGVDSRAQLTLPRLRRQLGVVQQEPVLFDRSLADNIAYGANERRVPMHELVAAAKAANIHSFIVSLPQGYETQLGAGGAQLSGGQKQRVCIARALVRAPRLLLLDEATSALDAGSERLVSEALEKAAEGRTCVTIAHRLTTVKDADLICVLDKGRIVEKGTHAELITMRGFYWKMCKGQKMA